MGFFSYALSHQRKFLIALSIFLVVVVTSVAFSSSLNNEFTNWDDPDYVTGNLLIRDLSWNKTKAIFTSFNTSNYHPLVFNLCYRIFSFRIRAICLSCNKPFVAYFEHTSCLLAHLYTK